jgi:ADP-ribose pyrophosphatase
MSGIKTSNRDAHLIETLVRRKTVYSGGAVDFRVDRVALPNGKRAEREFLDHPGAVGVIPILPGGRVVLVRQYRHPVAEVTLEIPAGKLDSKESPLRCVRRELKEETGYTAGHLRPLLRYWPTPAFANELLYLFVAENLRLGSRNPDEDEFLDVVEMSFKKALSLVRRGEIRDSKTVIALLAYELWEKRGRRP